MKTKIYKILAGMGVGIFAISTWAAPAVWARNISGYTRSWDAYRSREERSLVPYHKRDVHKEKGHVRPYRHAHNYPYFAFTYSVPFGSTRIRVNGVTYRYHSGTFYKQCDKGGYDIVPAPYGAKVRSLPSGYKVIIHKGKKYYRYSGTYYTKVLGGYVVSQGPDLEYAHYHGHNHIHYAQHEYCDIKIKISDDGRDL